jgi:hypothetical protein
LRRDSEHKNCLIGLLTPVVFSDAELVVWFAGGFSLCQ